MSKDNYIVEAKFRLVDKYTEPVPNWAVDYWRLTMQFYEDYGLADLVKIYVNEADSDDFLVLFVDEITDEQFALAESIANDLASFMESNWGGL